MELKFGSQCNALQTLAAGMGMRRRETHHFWGLFVCFSFFLTCLRSVPHCAPNKAYGKAATHTLLTMQLQFQVSSWKSVWCLHIWRCAYSQTTFMCDHGILMTYLHFRISTSVYSQGVACGFRIRRHSHVVWIYAFVIICVFLV